MGDIDFRFYLSLAWRRLPVFLLVAVSIACLVAVIARALPSVYRADAKILAEAPQIATDLASSTVPINPYQQMQVVEQRITTRDNLVKLAHSLGVYGDKAAGMTDERVAEDMRARTMFQQLDMSAPNGVQGATIFQVSFDARDPALAARVVNALAALIVDRSSSLRSQRATEATDFFNREASALNASLAQADKDILAFKTAHQDALPENLDFRQTRQENQQQRLAQLDTEEASLRLRRNNLVQLFEATGRIAAAGSQTPEQQMLADLTTTLAGQMLLFSADSPTIVALRDRIAALKQSIHSAGERHDGPSELDVQLSDIDGRLKAIGQEKAAITAEIGRLAASINATPANETALGALERRRDNLKAQYDTAIARLAAASTGEQIEASAQAGNFYLVEPAVAPKDPILPGRMRIAAMGAAGGVALGAALVVLLELLNKTIRRPRDLADLLQTQPLEVLPRIQSGKEVFARHFGIAFASLIAASAVPLALLTMHHVMPVDTLVLQAMSALGRPPMM